jgi:uncharacterized membrane protein (GlpM family)
MLFFMFGLLLKIAMTASIVVVASLVVERSGPFIGSLIAALPTAGGAAMIILAIEHPPAFIAQSVVGSVVSNAMVAIFALTYAALAQRRSLWVSMSGALLIWFCCAGLTRLLDWSAGSAALLNAVVFPLAILAGTRFRAGAVVKSRVSLSGADLVWRAGIVTLCVIMVTAASAAIGSFASGLFAFFPVAMGSYFVILHSRIGGPATASVAAHVQAPLIGLGLSLLAVHYLAEPFGVWWAYVIGLSIGIGWNVLLWLLRSWGLRR